MPHYHPPRRVLDALEDPHGQRDALPLAALRPLLAVVRSDLRLGGGRTPRSLCEVLDEDDDAERDEEPSAEQGPRREKLILHKTFEQKLG